MIKTQTRDQVGYIIVDRPDQLNALTREGTVQFAETFSQMDQDPKVHVIVISGAGPRSFCAGGDISEFVDNHDIEDALYSQMQSTFQQVAESKTPTIAAVNGYALGGGFELALACDIRIASSQAEFALPELGLAVLPAAGGTQRLTRLIGPGRAMDLILTGRRISARKAKHWGVVTELVEDGNLLNKAHELALLIRRKGPLAVTLGRTLVKHAQDVSLQTGLAMEALAQGVAYSSKDVVEGSQAFSEKREPNFEGK